MWILPSRGRPDACRELLANMVANGMTAGGVIGVNEDDRCRARYEALDLPSGWDLLWLPSETLGMAAAVRTAFAQNPGLAWYGVIADDNDVETPDFEHRLAEAAGEWGIASGNDLWQARKDIRESRMQGAIIFGGELLRALGWIVPEGFLHLYLDDVWETVGRRLNCWRVLMDVMTPHNHPLRLGSAMDETTSRVNEAGVYAADGTRFKGWLSDEAHTDLMRARLASWSAGGLSIGAIKGRSVQLAVPVYRDVSPFHYASMIETVTLLRSLGVGAELRLMVGVPVVEARNALANRFMASAFTDLMFIDADEAWDPWDVVRLLASGLPLVAGVGRKKSSAPDEELASWCFALLPSDQGTVPITDAGLVEVDAVGTGFMLVSRSVFEDLAATHPDWRRESVGAQRVENFFEYFACDLTANGVRRNGEDISFCHRYRAIGGRIFIDPTISIRHYGTHEYSGSLARFFEPLPAA